MLLMYNSFSDISEHLISVAATVSQRYRFKECLFLGISLPFPAALVQHAAILLHVTPPLHRSPRVAARRDAKAIPLRSQLVALVKLCKAEGKTSS